MSTISVNLPEIRIARDWVINVSEVTSGGNPMNLTGYTIELCIKNNIGDADNKALWKSSTLNNANLSMGKYGFKIPNSSTVNFGSGHTAQFEIIYKDPTGITKTKASGTIPITQSITLVIP